MPNDNQAGSISLQSTTVYGYISFQSTTLYMDDFVYGYEWYLKLGNSSEYGM